MIILPINSALSSLQQEQTTQSTGTITYQKNFADEIFFEYGAETGVLQPPFDQIHTGGIIEVDDTYARTGTKSIYFYQKAPPKTDMERRCHLRLYGRTHEQTEGYLSWWVWFGEKKKERQEETSLHCQFTE